MANYYDCYYKVEITARNAKGSEFHRFDLVRANDESHALLIRRSDAKIAGCTDIVVKLVSGPHRAPWRGDFAL